MKHISLYTGKNMNLCVYHQSIFISFFCKYKKCFHFARGSYYALLCIMYYMQSSEAFSLFRALWFYYRWQLLLAVVIFIGLWLEAWYKTIQQIQIHNWQVQILKVQSSFITFVTIISSTKDFGEKRMIQAANKHYD